MAKAAAFSKMVFLAIFLVFIFSSGEVSEAKGIEGTKEPKMATKSAADSVSGRCKTDKDCGKLCLPTCAVKNCIGGKCFCEGC